MKAVTKILNTKQDWTDKDFSSAYRKTLEELDQKRETFTVVFPLVGNPKFLKIIESFESDDFEFIISSANPLKSTIANNREQLRNSRFDRTTFERHLYFEKSAEFHVRYSAINSSHAYALARDRVDEILGMLAFVSNRSIFKSHGGLRSPLADVRIAPFTTVHKADGSLAESTFWYDNWNGSTSNTSLSDEDLGLYKDHVDQFRASIEGSNWQEDCWQALRMFAGFAAELDISSAFLLGWQLLEFLVSNDQVAGERTHTDAILNRACRFYADYEGQLVGASYFKDVRNSIAHGRTVPLFDDEDLPYHFKEFIRPVLASFILNPFAFQDKRDFLKFCDAGIDVDEVNSKIATTKREIHVLESALKFLRAPLDPEIDDATP